MKKVKIAYIGGGSRAWARVLMSDLAKQGNFDGEVNLFDIDYKAAKDNQFIGNSLKESKKALSFWDYKVKETLDEALKDVNFVIISILPGTFKEMASDVHAPEKYGLLQSVGDTTGPGGVIRAMKAIPMFEAIALAIKKNCPSAWVINYTNPMSMCLKTLYNVFPKIKALGCCHEVFSTQDLLCDAIKEIEGIENIKREDIFTEVCGINHFTFITKANYKNLDLYEVYKKFVDKYYSTGYHSDGNVDAYLTNVQEQANRVKMDLFKRYGVIAAAGDRHLAEFCPHNWYLKDRDTIHKFKFELTPVSWRVDDQKNKIENTKKYLSKEKTFDIYFTGEEGINILSALMGFGDIITNINFKNMGQYFDAPKNSIVETNMKISNNKVELVNEVKLPNRLNALILREIYNQQNTVEGCLKRDIDMVFSSFVNEPLCSALSLYDAKILFNEMVKTSSAYLQDWNIN